MDVIELIWHLVTGSSGTDNCELWGEIFNTRPERSWDPPNLVYGGYRFFSTGKTAGVWRWPPTPI